MPLPLAPVAGLALRYGAVALATYALARSATPVRRDQRHEDAMDEMEEGLGFRRDSDQVNGGGRVRRVIRVGPSGPGIEIDATALGRIRVRRV